MPNKFTTVAKIFGCFLGSEKLLFMKKLLLLVLGQLLEKIYCNHNKNTQCLCLKLGNQGTGRLATWQRTEVSSLVEGDEQPEGRTVTNVRNGYYACAT